MGLANLAQEEVQRIERPEAAPAAPSREDVFDGLTKYFPTESMTLYVAALSAQKALVGFWAALTPWALYLSGVFLTPLLFLLILIGKRAKLPDEPLLPRLKQWPWWKLLASTVAFAVWALAVPPQPTPELRTEAGGVVAAFLALSVSMALRLLEPIGERVERVLSGRPA